MKFYMRNIHASLSKSTCATCALGLSLLSARLIALLLMMLSLMPAHMSAAEPLKEGASVYIYHDASYKYLFKDMKKELRETLSAKNIKWKTKSIKEPGYIPLVENIEKELLKNKADRYILALGSVEFWDAKAGAPTNVEISAVIEAMNTVIQKVQATGSSLVICTPHQILAGTHDEANARLLAASRAITEACTAAGTSHCDLYTSFDNKNKTIDTKKKSKGATTKDGFKLNDVGSHIGMSLLKQVLSLSGRAITRDLQQGDVIIALGPFLKYTLGDFSLKLKEYCKPTIPFLPPRAVSLHLSGDLFDAKFKTFDLVIKSKPTILFVYPGNGLLSGVSPKRSSVDDGTFLSQLSLHLEKLRAELPEAQIFLFTPLIWRESTGANVVVPGGANFIVCEKWATHTKTVGDELGIPIIDLHQQCLDYIDTHGPKDATFAGKTNAKKSYYKSIETLGEKFVREAIAKAIHFDGYTE